MTINPETGTKYSREELKKAFERVEDKTHRKNPIRRQCPKLSEDEQELIAEAVVFFAGCVPDFEENSRGTMVTAVGYYVAVGA